ncbi:MAG: calcium-binding protein [Rhodocyclaceae bacterium]|nr:calcium-binding protein [Rhodocyclaceae bacterium]
MATIKIGKSGGTFTGTTGSDTYQLTAVPTGEISINGSTSTRDHLGNDPASKTGSQSTVVDALLVATDRKLIPVYRPGVVPADATGTDTNLTTGATYNAQDILLFSRSGDYTGLGAFFSNIETLQFGSGVKVRLSADIFENVEANADAGALNTGITFEGIGKKAAQVTFDIEFDTDGLTTPAVGAAYVQADVQLDDYSFAKLANDKVQLVYDARDPGDDDDDIANADGLLQSSFGRYFRFDGSNDSELVYGSDGVDYATLRLGNDTMFGYEGNDRLIGHGGADYLDGGDGDDLFEIGSFGSGTSGTSSKADDGRAEWIISASAAAANSFRAAVTNGITNATDYGNKTDVIAGGKGSDTLRVTTGIGATGAANGTVVLNDANFQKMERVEVGGAVSKDADESSYQQYRDGHLYFARGSTVSDTATSAGGSSGNSINKVVIDASGVTKNGLTFEGNDNTQTFIGTTKADVLIGNGGADTLTGAGGADKFVFQSIREYNRDSGTANGVIAYTPKDFDTVTGGQQDDVLVAGDADIITDFTTGTDKIVFRVEATEALEDTFDSLVALTKGNLTTTNVLIGDLTSGLNTAGSASQFIKVDTAAAGGAKVYYDADGSGAGAAVLIATLTGVSTVVFSDFRVEAVQGF